LRILLVEDDQLLAKGIETALERAGYTVDHTSTAKAALANVRETTYELILLDLGLPDMDGLVLLQTLRDVNRLECPILILTARDQLNDKVSGLDAGADDYLPKPFELEELLARLRALVRRRPVSVSNELVCGALILDTEAWQATYQGATLALSRRELMVLRLLMESQNKVVTKAALTNALYSWDDDIGSNTLEVYIHGLRKQTTKQLIKTVRGVGYLLQGDQTQ
jgi:DNA-binding response OmpR family regulator